MRIIKEKIKLTNNDINLKVSLNTNDNFLGHQQEINRLIHGTGNELINEVDDLEIRRLKYDNEVDQISFEFYNGGYYNDYVTGNIFTQEEFSQRRTSVAHSFYMLDLFDHYNINIQNKLSTSYFTKIYNNISSTQSLYNISDIQFKNLNLPINYIDQQEEELITGYTRLTFFNGKTGNLILFQNQSNAALKTSERIHFPITVNLTNKIWYFNESPVAQQIYINQEYVDKINDTMDRFDNQLESYPTGNSFNYETGTYDII